MSRDVEGFVLAFLAVAGWCAVQRGEMSPGGDWVDLAEAARERGYWYWSCRGK